MARRGSGPRRALHDGSGARRTPRWALAAVLAALRPAPAGAEEPPPQPAPAPIEVVVTGTRTPESSQRATVRTRVVTREEAERRGATNVGEALDGELGVQVNPSAYGSIGRPSVIQIQGFDLNRVLVLEDGERVIGDTNGGIDLSSLPLTDVSRIELVTGPTSSLYGTSAIGGVVNVISAPPATPGASGRARVEGRSRAGLLGQGSAAYRQDDTWISADASFQREDGLSLLEGSPALALPYRSQRLLGLRAGTSLAKGVDVRLRGRWLHDRQDGLEVVARPGLSRPYLIDLPETTDRFTLNLNEQLDLGGGSNLRFAAARQWALRSSGRDYRDSPVGESRERSGVLQSFESIATLADGKARTWVAGARFEIETLEQKLTQVDVSTTDVSSSGADEVPYTRLGSLSAYGQLSWKLTETMTVMPGFRGELHLNYGGIAAPRLALSYRPSDALTLRLSGGRGFRAPNAKELGFSFDHSYLGYCAVGNRDLDPETSWGVNGDVTLVPDKRVTLRIGGFANWVEDLIDFDTNPLEDVPCGGQSSGALSYQYRNISEARTSGAELSAALRPAPWLRTEIGYAYLWTRNDTNEEPLTGKPPHTAQASVRAELPWKLELIARYRAVTSAYLGLITDAYPAVVGRAPGFQTLDIRLARPLWPSAQAYVGMRNLFGTQKDPTRLGDQRPVEGRTLYLGLIAELPLEDS